MASQRDERLFCIHFDLDNDDAHVVPAPVLVDSIANIQRVVYLLAKLNRGEELGRRASFSRPLREEFALQCRVAEPGSYAVPFEIGNRAASSLPNGETSAVSGLFQRLTAALGGGDVDSFRELVPDLRYVNFLIDAFRRAQPPARTGVSYWIEDHRHRRILDSRKAERTLDYLHSDAGQHRRIPEDTISGMLVAMNFDKRSITLTRPDGKTVTAAYDEDSERPLIEHRRGWIKVTGDVLYDADGQPLSVTHARDFVAFDDDTIELGRVNLYSVPYRAEPPLRFKVSYDARDRLYDLDGEFGIAVSAYSRSELHHELHEALSMLWIEYGEESSDRLSPKARGLRARLRKRLQVA